MSRETRYRGYVDQCRACRKNIRAATIVGLELAIIAHEPRCAEERRAREERAAKKAAAAAAQTNLFDAPERAR